MLLVAGWLLVLSAIALLRPGMARNVFAAAGLLVEALGLTLTVRAHVPLRSDRD